MRAAASGASLQRLGATAAGYSEYSGGAEFAVEDATIAGVGRGRQSLRLRLFLARRKFLIIIIDVVVISQDGE